MLGLSQPFVSRTFTFSSCFLIFPDGIVCKIGVALDAQRAVHSCIQTPTFLYLELALQLFGVPVGAQPRAVVRGLGRKCRQPRIPRNRLQSGPPMKLT